MRIAMIASECEPFAKTGGLADVVDALARALAELGHQADVYLPRYRGLEPPAGSARLPMSIRLPSGPGPDTLPTPTAVSLWDCPGDGYRLRLVDHPPSFDREGLYGQDGTDYPDNGARFALLGQVALAAAAADDVSLDVMHGHDWQAGPALLAMAHGARSEAALQETVTVLTCHNLAFHGWVPPDRAWQLGLPASVAGADGVDLLRAGIGAADMVNTVSPTYAVESLTARYGGGVDTALRARGDTYRGILNGLDSNLWDPATDGALAATYDRGDLSGKAADRLVLAARHGLSPDGPIFGMVGRLDPQKGFDLVAGAASGLLAMGGRLIVLGTGDARLLAELGAVARRSPDRVALLDRFDRDEARRIYAGADIFLMPSRFEPSGQGQLIALRYGTVPLVRRTGGLADTIRDVDAPRAHGTIAGNGYVFEEATPEALLSAAQRAVSGWANRDVWTQLVRRGMAEDHSWVRPARLYEQLYHDARQLRSRSSDGREAADASDVVPRP
ncbi:MAG: glycogen synthase [Chloroflexota bacterium]|nr:glycogen synthase [Chloroflexota bacterium]